MKEILSGKLLILGILLIAFISALLMQKKSFRYYPENLESLDQESMAQLLRLWRGEIDFPIKCSQYHIKSACNPFMWQCLGESSRPYIEYRNRKLYLASRNNRFFQTLARSQGDSVTEYGHVIWLKKSPDSHLIFPVILEDSCSDSYLPQRVFLSGSFDDLEQYSWDNHGKQYFIDIKPVANWEIYLWLKKIGNNALAKNFSDQKTWARTAIGLNIEQQKAYCHFRSKRLMQSHLFDAATFAPIHESSPRREDKGRWPWTRRRMLSELMQGFQLGEEELCQMIPSSECLEWDWHFGPHENSASWMGARATMGGVLEAMQVVWSSTPVLKVSSFLFPLRSPMNQAAVKADWSGLGSEMKTVGGRLSNGGSMNLSHFTQELPIGFRCFKERSE
jgi:hypothetical protein